MTDPLSLPAGVRRADLRRAGEPPTAAPTLSGSFTVVADQRVTVAALLDPDAKPSWVAFPNDASPVGPAAGEVRFRHFGAIAPVSVLVDGQVALSGVTNLARSGQAAPLRIAPRTHQIAVQDASGAVLVASSPIEVPAGAPLNVYLTGRAAGTGDAAPALLLETPVAPPPASAQRVPGEIPGGNSGLADAALNRTTSGATGPGDQGFGDRTTPIVITLVVGVALLAAAGRGASRGQVRRPGGESGTRCRDRPVHADRGPNARVRWRTRGNASRLERAVAHRIAGHSQCPGPTAAAAGARHWPGCGFEHRRVLANGALELPTDLGQVGWFSAGPAPWESGVALLAAHVDYDGRTGSFFRLAELPAGSEVLVERADGVVTTFRTHAPRLHNKARYRLRSCSVGVARQCWRWSPAAVSSTR